MGQPEDNKHQMLASNNKDGIMVCCYWASESQTAFLTRTAVEGREGQDGRRCRRQRRGGGQQASFLITW